ncbi:RT0821/Lpp0805 family surface protein [Mesorhizobium sp. A623]
MSRVAQAFDSLPASVFVSASLKAGMLIGVLVVAGCGAGGFSLEQAEVDRTLYTSSVPAASPTDDSSLVADQATIRNAVSSADVETLAGQDIPWANSETGSRGAISQLTEDKSGGRLCRSFAASRESFDGVSLFKGEACMIAAGVWRLEAFAAR